MPGIISYYSVKIRNGNMRLNVSALNVRLPFVLNASKNEQANESQRVEFGDK